ncbi:ABC transporter permease [Thermodesulfovibrionales bacterium]|nr:ABC transporter permease [Thermodesulfovibrionales bacterium]
MKILIDAIRQLARYPSAIAGLIIIGTLIGMSFYAVITIPYSEAIKLWQGRDGVWNETPRNAEPKWVNLFPGINLPETFILNSEDIVSKSLQPLGGGIKKIEKRMEFDFGYDCFPQEMSLFFDAAYDERPPHVFLTWLTPDGREINLAERRADAPYRISLDRDLAREIGGLAPEVGLFADPFAEEIVLLQGRYGLQITGWLFEEDSSLDVRLVVFGQVHGIAGTDHMRRDLMVALLWGAPIALTFGFLAAVGVTASTFIIAAIGVWFGRWVDAVIRWITQVNIILPVLPILIIVGTFYSRSIWVMLGVIIALSIFSAGIFVYRAMFLQIKGMPYIEAAKAYGASNFRIIFQYMLPKLVPVLIPAFVMTIPAMVFLEASLAVLGLGDPLLPTWGKVLKDAWVNGALLMGHYYWVLLPSALLMMTGLGFAMVGYALDRIFNPRLRES